MKAKHIVGRNGVKVSIGMDLHDKRTQLVALSGEGEILREEKFATTRAGVRKVLGKFEGGGVQVVVEAGTHSGWVSREIKECGHGVIVANPRVVPLVGKRKRRKNDRLDAESLAHWGLHDPYFLAPVEHRGAGAQRDLSFLRTRHCLVEMRTEAINHVRSIVKVFGERLPSTDAHAFHRKVKDHIPEDLRMVLWPMLETIGELTARIGEYDKLIEELCEEKYPETKSLRQVSGVGVLTALTFVLTLEDPRRFSKSRLVGAFLGLVPALFDSAGKGPQLRIAKTGDLFLRQLLVQCAHYILGPFGPDCELRRFGERMASRGGKNAKKRAAVAVARKLAVLLHRLWVSGDTYDPFYNSRRKAKKRA